MALAATAADAEPRPEPLHPRANRPYQVFGRDYVPLTERRAFRERGMASWYGRKFQGLPTSTGEPYDMYAMTGAHPTLPLPSFVRVTNLDSGHSIVVRLNDRGPFLKDRVIDLSAAAAHRLGYYEAGSARVEVEMIGTAATTEGQEALRLLAADPAAASAPASAPAAGRQAPTVDVVAPRYGHYVQLAAFGSRPAAEAAQRRLQARFDWLEAPVRVVENAAVFRVQAGPYDDHQRAREMATRIERATGQRPWIVARP
jgi:rare lipoprotein A